MKGDDLERAQALLSGDKTHIYAVELKHAVADESRKGLEAVYAQIRADVETKAAEEAKAGECRMEDRQTRG